MTPSGGRGRGGERGGRGRGRGGHGQSDLKQKQHQMQESDNEVLINFLPKDITQKQLKEAMKKAGHFISVKLLDSKPEKNQTVSEYQHAYVTFKTSEDVAKCIQMYNGSTSSSTQKPLQVTIPKQRQDNMIMGQIPKPEQKVCTEFAKHGKCKFGDRCKFSHDIQTPQNPALQVEQAKLEQERAKIELEKIRLQIAKLNSETTPQPAKKIVRVVNQPTKPKKERQPKPNGMSASQYEKLKDQWKKEEDEQARQLDEQTRALHLQDEMNRF